MTRLRLAAFDMDGTLLNSSRELDQETIHAVRDAQEAGLIICLASGRAISTILPWAEVAGIEGPIVSCNGAYVVDADRNEVHHDHLAGKTSDHLIQFGRENQIHTNVYSGLDIHFSSLGSYGQEYMRRARFISPIETDYEEMLGLTATKVLYMGPAEQIDEVHAHLEDSLSDGQAAIVRSEADYVEFLPFGINKGAGLMKAAAHLGIAQAETAAIGDYWNDLEMIEWAGFSAAVDNAVDGVKDAADVVVPHHDQGGAVAFLEQVVARL
jgi:Cof subfamily protein (haloacid dehalogenase superfamily)